MKPNENLFEKFKDFLKEHRLLEANDRVLLAVSGGVDSMVMVRLFSHLGLPFAIAHCNFSLRGKDSELDMELVKNTAHNLKVPFYSITFNTPEYSRQKGISIQEAARELRYNWLADTAKAHQYSLIATAHHLDDSIETMLINLLRGTGIRGLAGIPLINGNIIRPLLFATREEIESFADQQQVTFRTDVSNLQDKYLRNRLRHHIIPVLKELDPGFHHTMQSFLIRMKASSEVLEKEVNQQKALCISNEKSGISIRIDQLLASPSPRLLLYEFLKDYNFSGPVCEDLFESLNTQAGKQFFSKTHKAIKDRDQIFIVPLSQESPDQEYQVDAKTSRLEVPGAIFTFEVFDVTEKMKWPKDENAALLDLNQLQFPLVLRKAKPGDRFVPLGMKGKKKISDLLTDEKIPRHLKPAVWVLLSGGVIAWVAGLRLSDPFKITPATQKALLIKIVNS